MTCFILTGPIQSGKTTALRNEFSGHVTIGGFFSPVLDGKRHFQHTETGRLLPMEFPKNEADAMAVGRFLFSKSAFLEAKRWFLNDFISQGKQMLILDEIGPLELEGSGFSDLVSLWLKEENGAGKVLLMVARDTLPEKILKQWPELKNRTTLISKDELTLVWDSFQ